MANPHVGQIRMFGGPKAPKGWMFCDGTELQISKYGELYDRLKTTYGGDGETTFALPDMRARLPVGQGAGPGLTPRALGEKGGQAEVQIELENMPKHTHQFRANALDADTNEPASQAPALGSANPSNRIYSTNGPTVDMSTEAVAATGDNQPYSNLMRSLCVNFIIAVEPRLQTLPGRDFSRSPFIGEIRIFPYAQGAPIGWVSCLCLQEYQDQFPALRRVLGDSFKERVWSDDPDKSRLGGPNFLCWIPSFRGRTPMHPGEILSDKTLKVGQRTGAIGIHLNQDGRYLPTHTHQLRGDNTNKGAQSSNNPRGNVFGFGRFAGTTDNDVYSQSMPDTTLQERIFSFPTNSADQKPDLSDSLGLLQPYLAVNFYIAYQGIDPYPS